MPAFVVSQEYLVMLEAAAEASTYVPMETVMQVLASPHIHLSECLSLVAFPPRSAPPCV